MAASPSPMAAPRPEVLNDAFWDITGQRLDRLSLTDARRALDDTRRVEEQLQKRSLTMRQLDDHIVNIKKGWFAEYVKGQNGWLSFGTLGKLVTAKPVEGVVNTLTFNKVPLLGKIARWATVAAGLYYGIGLLKQGAVAAYGGGNILLDRIGVGGGHLFPPMDMPPAPPSLQPLPPADIGATA